MDKGTLAPGHRSDFYLLVNARRISAQRYRRMPNWAFAMELFATGSTSAWRICVDAGIDPNACHLPLHPSVSDGDINNSRHGDES